MNLVDLLPNSSKLGLTESRVERSRSLNKALDEIVAFEHPDWASFSTHTIDSIHNKIDTYESLANNYSQKGSTDYVIEGHIDRINEAGTVFNEQLKALFEKEHNTMLINYQTLKTSITPDVAEKNRTIAKKSFENVKKLHNYMNARNQRVSDKQDIQFYDCRNYNNHIISLDKRITKLEQEASIDDLSQEQRDKIKKSIYNSKIFDKSLDTEVKVYPEGRARLNSLVNKLDNYKSPEEIKIESLNTELNNKENFYKADVQSKELMIERNQERLKELELQKSNIKEESSTYKADIDRLTKQQESHYNTIDQLTSFLAKEKEQNESYEAKLEAKDEELKYFQNQLNDISSEIATNNKFQEGILKEYLNQVSQLEEEIQLLKSQYDDSVKQKDDELNSLESNYNNQLQEKESKIKSLQENKSSLSELTFSLPSHIRDIGYPNNYEHYPIRNALLNGDKRDSWKDAFDQVNNFLDMNLPLDHNYLLQIAYGIKKAVDHPLPGFDVESAAHTYEKMNEKLTSHLSKAS